MSIEDKLYSFLSLYKKMPDWMKRIMTIPLRLAPREIYLGKNYKMFFNLFQKLDKASSSEIEEFQYLKIKQILKDSYQHVPYYRDKWSEYGIDISSIKSLDDFKKIIPFTPRIDIQEEPLQFISEKYNVKDQLLANSGGSTGTPLNIYYLKGYTRSAERAYWNYCFGEYGYMQGYRMARLRGDFIGEKKIFSFDPYRNCLIMSSFNLNINNVKKYLEAFNKYKIEYLAAYPASCIHLINLCDKLKYDFPYMKAIILGSENMYDDQINKIKSFFGINKVLKSYGHAEAVVAASNCLEKDIYHFHPVYGYVEFQKSEDLIKDKVENIKEIVGTSFINPLMPLIRYRTNDFGVEFNQDCNCSRNHNSLKEIIGREQEMAVGFNGEKITLTALIFGRHLDYFSHIYKMQLFNTEPGKLVVNVVPKKTFDDKHQKEIISSLSVNEGMPFETSLEIVDDIQSTKRGKHKLLIRNF